MIDIEKLKDEYIRKFCRMGLNAELSSPDNQVYQIHAGLADVVCGLINDLASRNLLAPQWNPDMDAAPDEKVVWVAGGRCDSTAIAGEFYDMPFRDVALAIYDWEKKMWRGANYDNFWYRPTHWCWSTEPLPPAPEQEPRKDGDKNDL